MIVPDARTAVGRWLRLPLRLLPAETVVRVVSGPMRGMRWVVGAAPHGAWLGTLEREKLSWFVERLRPGMVVWDVGANAGLYTLPSARVVAPGGRVYAFEPMTRNIAFLRRHIAMNRLVNVDVRETAVADVTGTLRMAEGDSPSEFHVDPHGDHEVAVTTLDSWRAAAASPPPDLVKIDVEGSEGAVLRGGARTLSEGRPAIFLSLHGERQRCECRHLLDRWGYRVSSIERGVTPAVSSEWLAEAR